MNHSAGKSTIFLKPERLKRKITVFEVFTWQKHPTFPSKDADTIDTTLKQRPGLKPIIVVFITSWPLESYIL